MAQETQLSLTWTLGAWGRGSATIRWPKLGSELDAESPVGCLWLVGGSTSKPVEGGDVDRAIHWLSEAESRALSLYFALSGLSGFSSAKLCQGVLVTET